jgi:hypothetical protein
MGKSKKKSLLLRAAQSDGPHPASRPSPDVKRCSRSFAGGSPISTLTVPIKAQGGFSHHPPASQVPVTNTISFTQTLYSVNNDVPRYSSVIRVARQILDECPELLAGHNMNSTQQALVVASPQPASQTFQLPLAGGVNGHSPSVALPGGFGQGSPPSSSPPPGINLSLVDEDCPRVTTLPTTASGPDLTPVCSFYNYDVCPLLPEDFGELRDIWKLCLIGYSISKTLGYTILGKYMANVWKCNATLHIHDSGWLVFRFSSATNMGRVLCRGPYSFQGKPLVLKPMPPYFDFGKLDMLSVLVWVRLLNFPLECWSPACLSKISSVIGKPIRCDDLTLSMSRVSFARVMIEVNLSDDLPRSISLSMPDGTIIKQRVIYEYKPQFCSICCIPGHTSNVCQKLNSGAEDTSGSGMIKQASASPSWVLPIWPAS